MNITERTPGDALLVFGSINLDVSICVQRLPQPGETILGHSQRISPGGKGANQANAARQFGSPVIMVGAVGNDAFADAALAELRRSEVNLDNVRRLASARTGLATISVTETGENSIVVDSAANNELRADWVCDELLESCNMLLLQLEVPPAECMALAKRFKQRGGKVILNLAPARELPQIDPEAIDWLIVNEAELAALCRSLAIDVYDLGHAVAHVAADCQCNVVWTRGAAGVLACLRDGARLDIAAHRTQVVDTTGAGDTFCGVLAAALNQNHEPSQALRYAGVAASLACSRSGAQIAQPSRADIDRQVRGAALHR